MLPLQTEPGPCTDLAAVLDAKPPAPVAPAVLFVPLQLLLSLEYDDDWVDNPVVAHSWAINWDFKEAFEEAFEVR